MKTNKAIPRNSNIEYLIIHYASTFVLAPAGRVSMLIAWVWGRGENADSEQVTQCLCLQLVFGEGGSKMRVQNGSQVQNHFQSVYV